MHDQISALTGTHLETHQRSDMETSHITANQKEQLLNKVLKAHELSLKRKNKKQAKILLSTYQKLQTLKAGQSLSIEDTLQLKRYLKNTVVKKRVNKEK